MTAKIKPLGDRLLVKREEAIMQKGSILLPDSAKEKPRQGVVIAAGPGKFDEEGRLQPLTVKVGDKVLFGAYAGSEIKEHDEKDLMLLSEEEILAIVEA